MHIESFQISNYKSFLDTGVVELSSGLNIIVGKNNSGKSSLLKGISFDNEPQGHKDLGREISSIVNDESIFGVKLVLSGKDLSHYLKGHSGAFEVPVPKDGQGRPLPPSIDALKSFFSGNMKVCIGHRARYTRGHGGGRSPYNWIPPGGEAFEADFPFGANQAYRFKFNRGGVNTSDEIEHLHSVDSRQLISTNLWDMVYKSIYRFGSEIRYTRDDSYSAPVQLEPNGSNLASALVSLQKNRNRYNRLVEAVKEVMPEVQDITASIEGAGRANVQVWFHDPRTEMDDLAIDLADCGTGLFQVIAVLSAVIMSPYPRTILIDEPTSFLHPGAAVKLIKILRRHSEHQYIIATHSPVVIANSHPDKIVRLKYEKGKTRIECLSSRDFDEAKATLSDLGVRLSDVFGADGILWVEGPTEELCLPVILKHFPLDNSLGLEILSVKNTGDMEGSYARVAFEAYQKISGANSLVPTTVRFFFDSEGKSTKEIDRIKQIGGECVYFTSRKMYENYILSPRAISSVLSKEYEGHTVASEDVTAWMEKQRQINYSEWESEVHASKLLEELFETLGPPGASFRKVKHSLAITEEILSQDPDFILPLVEELERVFQAS